MDPRTERRVPLAAAFLLASVDLPSLPASLVREHHRAEGRGRTAKPP